MFKWYTDYKLRKLQLQLDAQNKPFELMSAAIAAQQQFLQSWLDSFKVSHIPASSVVRDIDEWQAEQERNNGLDSSIQQSIRNAMKAGAMQDLAEMLDND